VTPAVARDMYQRFLGSEQRVGLRRPGTPAVDILDVPAKIRDYSPEELVSGIYQGKSEVIVLAEYVTFSPGVRIGDQVIDDGLPRAILGVKRRRVGTEIIAYALDTKG
jgi:hypothetical protein